MSSSSSSDLPQSSLFHADQRLCSADILTPPEVRARIEVAVLSFLKTLASPSSPAIPDLPLVFPLPPPPSPLPPDSFYNLNQNDAPMSPLFLSPQQITRRSDNTALRRALLGDVSSLFLSHAFCTRSLSRPTDAKAFIRVWKVMELCFKILGQGKMLTQRKLFYKLLCDSPDYFTSQSQANRTVQGSSCLVPLPFSRPHHFRLLVSANLADVVALLRCTRQSLGIMASSRGAIAGSILLQEPDGEAIDCTMVGPAGHVITGDLNLLSRLVCLSDARYIVVVEKDAIFQRLAEDRLFSQIPCILITAKGYPDIATRFILHRLSQSFPDMLLLALVDWNPAGLAILCTYKFGSITMGLEAYRYACNVKWLGLRGDDLHLIPRESFVPLKPRDLQIAKSLMSSKLLQDTYKVELGSMVEMGHRVEIEALYCHGFDFLGKYIARKIVQSSYI